MEATMKLLVSAMALAIALMWPAAGEAQGKQAKGAKSTQQSHAQRYANVKRYASVKRHADVQRHAKVHVARRSTEKPCAARTWAGCQGWDPDPNVRSMIQMDAGRDDQ
jgi:hypothetical protein